MSNIYICKGASSLKLLHRISHFFRRRYTKRLLRKHEHVFQHQEVELKYLFVPKKSSRVLIVVFSGMNPNRASYNYIDILNDSHHNRLYILDDFGDERLGCFYHGTNGHHQAETAIKALLNKIQNDNNIPQLIFCGSSKGGYAALNFGLDYPTSVIIAGAPQYYLGYYLTHRKSPELLNIIAGKEYSQTYIENINKKICSKISSNAADYRGKIYLHFSNNEHTYDEHIQYLLLDLDRYNYTYEVECMSYPHHDDVAIFFPVYLKKILSEI